MGPRNAFDHNRFWLERAFRFATTRHHHHFFDRLASLISPWCRMVLRYA